MPQSKTINDNQSYIQMCITEQISEGKTLEQASAYCYNVSGPFNEPPVSVEFESINDYPKGVSETAQRALNYAEENGWGSCGTQVGKTRANQLAKGEPISEDTVKRMYSFLARHKGAGADKGTYGEGCGRLMYDAWGGDAALSWSERKVNQLKNTELVSKLKKTVLVSEDTKDEVILDYIKSGFKPHILAKRKVRKKDKKVYNRLKSLGLNADIDLKFGDIKDLHSKYKYDAIITDENPLIVMLENLGTDLSKYKVLKSQPVNNFLEATESLQLMKDVELKFITVKTVFTYELRPEFSNEIISTTRDFCRRIIGMNKAWSLQEIASISGQHLQKMGLPNDVFTFTGGFYRFPGTTTTQPMCRHQWTAKIVIEQ